MLGLTATLNETRSVLAKGHVTVDGRIRRDYKYSVGLMDVIEIPEVKTRLRVLPSTRHYLQLHKVTKKEANLKLCKITGKKTGSKGNIQLHCHDGRTLLLPVKDAKAKPKVTYRPGDSILIKVPDQTIRSHIPLKKGIIAVITGGDHTGFLGKLIKIDLDTRLGTLQGAKDATILTAMRYVFPVGEEKPLISIPEAG